MKNSLKSEALKLRTLRSTWVVAGVAAALSAVIGVVQVRVAATAGDAGTHLAHLGLGPVQALWFLVVGIAVVASAGEFQHRTIRTTVLLTPRRSEVLLSKSLVSGAFGAVIVAAGIAVAMLAAVITALGSDVSFTLGGGADWGRILSAVGLGAMWSVLAAALGVLTRSTAIAITALLLWRFVGEGLLPVLLSGYGLGDTVSRWTPTGTASALVGASGPPAWAAALVFAAYAGVMCAAAAVLFIRRDPV
jgi:ABC-2 type transport system permease protein